MVKEKKSSNSAILHLLSIGLAFIIVGIIASFLLGGCASSHKCEAQIITKEVKVPVYKTPEYPDRQLPKLPISKLNRGSSYQDVVTSYDKTVIILMNEIKVYRGMIYKESKDGEEEIK